MKGVLQKRSTFTQRARNEHAQNTGQRRRRGRGKREPNPPPTKNPTPKNKTRGSRFHIHGDSSCSQNQNRYPPCVAPPLLVSAAAPSPPFFPLLLLCHFAVNSRYHGEDRGCAVSSSWALQDALCLSWLVALGFLCSLSLSLSFELMAF